MSRLIESKKWATNQQKGAILILQLTYNQAGNQEIENKGTCNINQTLTET